MDKGTDQDAVRAVFPTAVSLLDYIHSILTPASSATASIVIDSDSQIYKDLLVCSLVIPDLNSSQQFTIPGRVDAYPIKETVNRIVANIIRTNQSYREQNCLTLGYRQKSSNANTSMRSNIDLECYFVNTIQPLVSTKAWQQLAHRIGEVLMHHIFLRPLFVKTVNGCYIQLSGVPVSELVFRGNRQTKEAKEGQVPNNKLSTNTMNTTNTAKRSHSLTSCTSSSAPTVSLEDSAAWFSNKIARTASVDSICRSKVDQCHSATSSEPPFLLPSLPSLIAQLPPVSLEVTTEKPVSSSEKASAVLRSLVQPSQSVPRHSILYKAIYQKRAGLPKNHLFHKNATSEMLCAAAFGTVWPLLDAPSLSPSAKPHFSSALGSLMESIRSAYKDCDTGFLLHMHCPTTVPVTGTSAPTTAAVAATTVAPPLCEASSEASEAGDASDAVGTNTALCLGSQSSSQDSSVSVSTLGTDTSRLPTATVGTSNPDIRLFENTPTKTSFVATPVAAAATSAATPAKWKKTKRGTRGGSSAKQQRVNCRAEHNARNKATLPTQPNQPVSNPVDTNGISHNKQSNFGNNTRNNGNNNGNNNTNPRRLITVGARLFKKLMSSISCDRELRDCGYRTQEDTDSDGEDSTRGGSRGVAPDYTMAAKTSYNPAEQTETVAEKSCCASGVFEPCLPVEEGNVSESLCDLISPETLSHSVLDTTNCTATEVAVSTLGEVKVCSTADVHANLSPVDTAAASGGAALRTFQYFEAFQYEYESSVNTSLNTSLNTSMNTSMNTSFGASPPCSQQHLSQHSQHSLLSQQSGLPQLSQQSHDQTRMCGAGGRKRRRGSSADCASSALHSGEKERDVIDIAGGGAGSCLNSSVDRLVDSSSSISATAVEVDLTTQHSITTLATKNSRKKQKRKFRALLKRCTEQQQKHDYDNVDNGLLTAKKPRVGNEVELEVPHVDCSPDISLPRSDSGHAHHLKRHQWATHDISSRSACSRAGRNYNTSVIAGNNTNNNDLPADCDLLSLSTPHSAVVRFITSFCVQVLPYQQVWGSRRNQSVFLSCLASYVALGRNETITLTQLSHRIELSAIPWLQMEPSRDSEQRPKKHNKHHKHLKHLEPREKGSVSSADQKSVAHIQSQLLLSFLLYLYAEVLNPLLSTCFYVTEVETRGGELLYFRKPVWARIVRRGLLQMKSHFVPVVLFGNGSNDVGTVSKPNVNSNSNPSTATANSLPGNAAAVSSMPPPQPSTLFSSSSALKRHSTMGSTVSTAAAAHQNLLGDRNTTWDKATTTSNSNVKDSSVASGSLLFNTLLRDNKYAHSASLSEHNRAALSRSHSTSTIPTATVSNRHVSNFPSSSNNASGNTVNVANAQRMKAYLSRIPTIRFVPKKTSVRAITNLKTKKLPPFGTATALSAANKSGSISNSSTSLSSTHPHLLSEVLTNTSLYNCYHVLKNTYNSNPLLGGFGAFGIDDIYVRFRKYLASVDHSAASNRLAKRDCKNPLPLSTADSICIDTMPAEVKTESPRPKFYMAVLDLEKCYDNVDTKLLYDLVRDILLGVEKTSDSTGGDGNSSSSNAVSSGRDAENMIHKYTVTHNIASMNNRVVSKTVRYVATDGDIIPFAESSMEIAKRYRNSIITDGVVYNRMANSEVLRLLRIHLFSHVVRINAAATTTNSRTAGINMQSAGGVASGGSCAQNNKIDNSEFHTQVKGIPQGSVLSPLLCNLYYGNIESSLFNNEQSIEVLGLNGRSCIIRLMDDYCMVSLDQQCVQHFLQALHLQYTPFGSSINPLKTRVNFAAEVEVAGQKVALQQIASAHMPWCGLLINTETLEITPNLARLLERPLRFSVNIELSKSGLAFKKAVKTYLRMKCHAIILDAHFNSKRTVFATLYSMYLLAAMRTYAYLKKLRLFRLQISPSFLCDSVLEGVVYGARLLRSRTAMKSSRTLRLGANAEEEETQEYDCDDAYSSSAIHGNGSGRMPVLFDQCVAVQEPENFGSCVVTMNEAIWLGLRAFRRVLSCRHAQYWRAAEMLSAKMAAVEQDLRSKKSLKKRGTCNDSKQKKGSSDCSDSGGSDYDCESEVLSSACDEMLQQCEASLKTSDWL